MTAVRLGILLVLVLLAPTATAAAADGRLDVEGPLALPSGAAMRAPTGEILWEGASVPTLAIEAASASLQRWGTTELRQDAPVGEGVVLSSEPIDAKATYGASTFTLEGAAEENVVALAAPGGFEARLGATDARPVSAAKLVKTSQNEVCEDGNLCLNSVGSYEFSALTAEGTAAGDLVLFVRGPTLVVDENGQETRHASGVTTESVGTATRENDVWIVVRLTGAVATFQATQTRVFPKEPTLDATAITLPDATGDVDVGFRSYRATDEDVRALGVLELALEAVAPGEISSTEDTVYASSYTANVRGDISTINLDAVPIYQDAPAETASATLGIVALLGAAAYFWPAIKFHATAAALPLYTRLSKPEILENDVRNGIYEIIRANPGISARAIHRMSDQSWGTVVYHLRQLERHHIVVSRALGRTRNYYENHGKYRGMEAQLACLQSDRARRLADLIAKTPGITQEDLVAQSGYPQPTTSYYVRKLKKAALVEETRDGRYVRYQPHADLPRYLELAESAPAMPPAADEPPTSVQA